MPLFYSEMTTLGSIFGPVILQGPQDTHSHFATRASPPATELSASNPKVTLKPHPFALKGVAQHSHPKSASCTLLLITVAPAYNPKIEVVKLWEDQRPASSKAKPHMMQVTASSTCFTRGLVTGWLNQWVSAVPGRINVIHGSNSNDGVMKSACDMRLLQRPVLFVSWTIGWAFWVLHWGRNDLLTFDIWHCIEHLASATAATVLSIQHQRSHPFPFRRLKLQRSHYPTSSSVEVRAKRRGSLRKRSLIQNRPAREKKPWKCHKHFINEPKKKMKHNKSKWLLANFGPPNHRLKSIWICIP